MEEQRVKSRINYQKSILCFKHIIINRNVKSEAMPIEIEITNISYSGLGVICNRDLGIGDFLIFDIVGNEMTKEVMVEVKWCRYSGDSYEAGFRFINLVESTVIFINDLIKDDYYEEQELNRT